MKHILLPALALLSGVGGFALRRWQLASCYDAQLELFRGSALPAAALLALLAVTAVLVLLLIRGGRRQGDFLPAFRCASPLHMTLLVMSAFVFLGAGLLGALQGMRELEVLRMTAGSYATAYPFALLLCGVLCVPSAFSLLLLGKGTYRGELHPKASLLSCFPPLACLVWLFAAHLNSGSDPILMRYGFRLAAAALLTLSQYYVTGFFFGRCHTRRCLFFSLMGISVGLTALADGGSRFSMALTAAAALSALAWSMALLRSTFAPPHPVSSDPAVSE